MNLKKITGIVVFLLLQISSNAQLNFGKANNGYKYRLKIPEIQQGPLNGHTPYTRVMLETGDGNFFHYSTGTSSAVEYIKPWFFTSNTSVQPVVQLNRFYDTTRIPKMASSFIFNPPITNSSTIFTSRLRDSKYILITPSVATISPGNATIIPGDTMTLALTYQPGQGGEFDVPFDSVIVAFYYNEEGITNLFSPITTATKYNFGGTEVKAIRMHNMEKVIPFSNIPNQIQSQLNVQKGNFKEALYFSVPYNSTEKNIFLSLAPNADSADYHTLESNVKAVIVAYKGANPSLNKLWYDKQHFLIDFASRDPNFMTVSPNSFKDISNAIDQNIYYHIRFENEGAGPADSIMIEVTLPKGIRLPASGTNLFACYVGGRPFDMVGIVGFPFGTKPKFCRYSFDRIGNKIKFKISNPDLKGTIESDGINNSGDIYFSLNTQKWQKIYLLESCMYSKVSIVFDTNEALVSSSLIRAGFGQCNGLHLVSPPPIHK